MRRECFPFFLVLVPEIASVELLEPETIHMEIQDWRSLRNMDGMDIVGHKGDTGSCFNNMATDLFDAVRCLFVEAIFLLPFDADNDGPGRVIMGRRVDIPARDIEIQGEPVIIVFRQTIKAAAPFGLGLRRRKILKRKQVLFFRKRDQLLLDIRKDGRRYFAIFSRITNSADRLRDCRAARFFDRHVTPLFYLLLYLASCTLQEKNNSAKINRELAYMVKKIALLVVIVVIALVAVMAVKTFTNNPEVITAKAIDMPAFDSAAAAGRLAEAVRIKTISHSVDDPAPASELDRLHVLISSSYPLVAEKLKREVVGGHSLLYTWQGSDSSLAPALLMGHMDVVPVEPGTEADWTEDAFSGAIKDGVIWGRGTLDDKLSVFAILEAAELQLAAGFAPKRTLYFAFGHDEEIGGEKGAAAIAALLKSRGVRLAFTLDEGMVVVQGIMPGIEQPIAFIARAEKGYLTLKLDATTEGGHSSIPPRTTAIGKIARAITRLEENRFPARLQSPASDMFDTLGPYMSLPLKAIISNRWLLDPLLVSELGKGGATNAMVRTTTAVTIAEGGTKDNVLPSTATATVNFRLLPGTTMADVVAHVTEVIDDPDVVLTVKQGNEPSRISSLNSDGYRLIEKTIRETLPDVLVSPGLMLAGSDSKHYEEISENNYRFIPMRFGPEDLSRVHGTNERILIDNYVEIIQFYRRLMQNAAG